VIGGGDGGLVRREPALALGTAMTVFCLGLVSVLAGLMLAFGSRIH
jgi:hypothetical protein